jgi:molecular chaperone GrpE (heat shock protein)
MAAELPPSADLQGAATENADKPQAENQGGMPTGPVLTANPIPAMPAASESPRVEVSAATITRMMGIATSNDLRLLEGRVDVLTSKVASLISKFERVLANLNGLPKSSDMDRLEIQIGGIKTMLREIAGALDNPSSAKSDESKQGASEQSKKIRDGIKSN